MPIHPVSENTVSSAPSGTSSGIAARYSRVEQKKSSGATYTPPELAEFVAHHMTTAASDHLTRDSLHLLDPALGDGELMIHLLDALLSRNNKLRLHVHGFETNAEAMSRAQARISERYPEIDLQFRSENFLESKLTDDSPQFDLIIANPPYVRTQILGADQSQRIAKTFGLTGRIDLYHAFLAAISQRLSSGGLAGLIVSNRFMTTRSGSVIRGLLREQFEVQRVWDLGDTQIFGAAVLPAVLVMRKHDEPSTSPARMCSIYETTLPATLQTSTPIQALAEEGVVRVADGRHFCVQHGTLFTGDETSGIWRVGTKSRASWLKNVAQQTWGTFRDIGKIRVGVKSCADAVFIRSDWNSLPIDQQPELLQPLTTHHIARQFSPASQPAIRQVLYPHCVRNGERSVVDLADFPRSRAYLESHRHTLERRTYVQKAGRKWYELWVPQDPGLWSFPKLVFRDISQSPCFWIDLHGTIVNGDCYWITPQNAENEDLLWLALVVGNSSFIETFYDLQFNNKLYAGRRRFITQYVEQFPLPDPHSASGQTMIKMAKDLFHHVGTDNGMRIQEELNQLVWKAFGVTP